MRFHFIQPVQVEQLYQYVSLEFAQLMFDVQAVTFKPAQTEIGSDDNLSPPLFEEDLSLQVGAALDVGWINALCKQLQWWFSVVE